MTQLLDDVEALKLIEFNPSVDPNDSWNPSSAMLSFLGKYFTRSLQEEEREAILKDFPKLSHKATIVPSLDEQVKDQLKRKGGHPNFGREITLQNPGTSP